MSFNANVLVHRPQRYSQTPQITRTCRKIHPSVCSLSRFGCRGQRLWHHFRWWRGRCRWSFAKQQSNLTVSNRAGTSPGTSWQRRQLWRNISVWRLRNDDGLEYNVSRCGSTETCQIHQDQQQTSPSVTWSTDALSSFQHCEKKQQKPSANTHRASA